MRKILSLICVVGALAVFIGVGSGWAEDHHGSKRKPTPTRIVKDIPGSGGRSTGPTHPSHSASDGLTYIGADLRTKMEKHMKLAEGDNVVVHTENGVKIVAEVKDGKVTNWKAVDKEGKPVPAEIMRAKGKCPSGAQCNKCFFCWKDDYGVNHCTETCTDAGKILRE